MSREFTREEMRIIANKCGVPVLPDGRATQGRLDEDGYWIDPWDDNANTTRIALESPAFHKGWFLYKEHDGRFSVKACNSMEYLSEIHESPTTAVLEAVLEGGHDTRMEVEK